MARFISIIQKVLSELKYSSVAIFIIAIPIPTSFIFAQDYGYNIEQISAKEGLVGNYVKSILQDNNGNIWLATNNGVIKYDGFQFHRFRQHSKLNSLEGREINDIVEDRDGNIWITAWGDIGLQRYNPIEDQFYAYKHDVHNPNSISGNFPFRIHIDRNENMWIAGLNGAGLSRVLKSKKQNGKDSVFFKNYPIDIQSEFRISHGDIWSIDDDDQGNLWVGTTNGLNKLHIKSGKITKYFHVDDDTTSLLLDNINRILIDSEGLIWIGTDAGLSCAHLSDENNLSFTHFTTDPKNQWPLYIDSPYLSEEKTNPVYNKNLNRKALHGNVVTALMELSKNKILVGTNAEGVTIFDKTRKEFLPDINNLIVEKFKITELSVVSLYKDKSGIVWMGSGNGVFKLTQNRFSHVRRNEYDASKLGHNTVYSFAEYKNHIWVSHKTGVDKYDPMTGQFHTYELVDGGKYLLSDHFGRLWAGTPDGLYFMDEPSDGFKHFHLPIYDFDEGSRSTSTLLADSDDNLWIGSWPCGISKIDHSDEHVSHYFIEGDSCAGNEANNVIISMHESKDKKIWAGTFQGLYVLDKQQDIFQKVISLADCGLITDGPGESILFASEDNMYALDLNNYDHIEEYIKNEKIEELFHINNAVMDQAGYLWISSPQAGLWTYNTKTKRSQQFSTKLGVSGYYSEFHSIFQAKDGSIYNGGPNGFNIFDPKYVMSGIPPQVSILKVELNSNKEDSLYLNLRDQIYKNKSITLPHHVHTINITFGVMDFHAQENNQYEYKLENFQNDWTSGSGSNNKATYTNLNQGKYTFKVRGSNSYGVWNEEGASLEIIVLPPPWKSWWAYSGYFLIFVGLVMGFRKYEMKRLKLSQKFEEEQKESKRLAELDTIKSNFFANISHEFRTPLTLMLGYIEKLKKSGNGYNDNEAIAILGRNTKRVLHLVNQLLDLSKIEAGTLELNYSKYQFSNVVKYIAAQFTSLAEMKNINLIVNCEDEIELFIDLEKMEMVINNLLSNAIKFTPENGKVVVQLLKCLTDKKYENGYVLLSVSDTGPGISIEEQQRIFDRFYQANTSVTRRYEGTGIGLSISKEIAHLHHGHIQVDSEPGNGSTFILKIPMGKNHLGDVQDTLTDFVATNGQDTGKLKNPQTRDADHPGNDGSKPYILIVEDNEDLRKYLEDNLRQFYQIKLAENGKIGYEMAIETIPELIVSDLMMPEMDGYTLCEKIKTDEHTSHIPFVLLTAKSDKTTKIDSLNIGADDYLLKPFDFEELHARINNLIKSREKLVEKYTRQLYLNPKVTNAQSMDEKFLAKIAATLEKQYKDSSFSVQVFAQELAVSEVQLFRKLKALTKHSPNEVIRNYRLQKAADLLQQNAGNVTEIAFDVGFNSLSYFAKCFKEKVGCSPKEFANNSIVKKQD